MLEDKDLSVRGRAAVALAQLSDFRPGRLMRVAARLKESLADDSAYVRWHLLYTLGKLGAKFPGQVRPFLPDIVSRLDDDHRICRILAAKALCQVAARKPAIIEECFLNLKRDIPSSLARVLRKP